MPGLAISQYLQQHTYDAFNEVVTVFRHDFVQYIGMLHSWTTLIEAEVTAAPDSSFTNPAASQPFRKAADDLRRLIEEAFHDTTSRLRPAIPHISATHANTVAYLSECWDKFFNEFVTSTLPRLKQLEDQTCQLVRHPDFDRVIEKNLGAAVEEPIKDMILRPYKRLSEMLNAENFDKRIGEVRRSYQNQKRNDSAAAI